MAAETRGFIVTHVAGDNGTEAMLGAELAALLAGHSASQELAGSPLAVVSRASVFGTLRSTKDVPIRVQDVGHRPDRLLTRTLKRGLSDQAVTALSPELRI